MFKCRFTYGYFHKQRTNHDIFVLRAQPITFYAASQLVQPKFLGYTVAAVFPPTGTNPKGILIKLMQQLRYLVEALTTVRCS